MKKARCTASLFVSCDYHTTPSPSWKNRTRGQVLGHFSVGSPLEFDSEQLGSRAAYVEAAGFERRTHQFGMAARVPSGRVQVPRDNRGNCDVGERTSSVSPLHLEQTPLEPLPFGVDQPLCSAMGRPPCSGTIFVAISNALEYRVRYSSTSKSKGGHPQLRP